MDTNSILCLKSTMMSLDSTSQLGLLSFLIFGCYLVCVRYYRYKALNDMIAKYPDPNVILQNHDIAMEIYSNIFRKEFPCK